MLGISHGCSLASARLAGEQRQWSLKQEQRTPGYTKDWEDLALVRA
jgi:DNA polymerase V